jgi:glycerophosphoryl diester phosphodiesterase
MSRATVPLSAFSLQLSAFSSQLTAIFRAMHRAPPRVLAHRGASGHELENSLAAFRRAVALNVDGIELDVHSTRDGELVVHHDAKVPGMGPISELRMAELAPHRLSNGEPIPTLEAALATIGDLEVWTEVKVLPAGHDQRLVRVLREGPAPRRYGVHSFDHRIVKRIGEAARDFRTGVLLAARLLDPVASMQAAGATVVWQEWSMIDADLVNVIHAASGEVMAWTVNEKAAAEQLGALGVDALCGNYPERLRVL